MLVDTHAHLHHPGLVERLPEVLASASAAGVNKIITVGVNAADSASAIEIASAHDGVYATVGLHPHEADRLGEERVQLADLAGRPQVVAIGECGLDYFRARTDRQVQRAAFQYQIELALEHNLPMVWHVREAFSDFFEIIDAYSEVRGIVHCFTSDQATMEKCVERGFTIALNGIMTFTKEEAQLSAARAVPLDNLVLETDCPFLAPVPMRGRTNEPAFMQLTAEFLAGLRGETVEDLSRATSHNAINLLGLANA